MITIAMLWTLLVLRLPFLALVHGSAYYTTSSPNDLKEAVAPFKGKDWDILNKMSEKAGSKSAPPVLLHDEDDDKDDVERFFKAKPSSVSVDDSGEDPIRLRGLYLSDYQKQQFYQDFKNYKVDLYDYNQLDSGLILDNKDYQGLENEDAVEEANIEFQRDGSARNARKKLDALMNEVYALMRRVQEEGLCRHPKPRLIPVKSIYRNNFNRFVPHCVILHQCSGDTACCEENNLVCGPVESKIEAVNLTLYVIDSSGTNENFAETLTFYNHTECTCLQRVESMNEDFTNRDIARSINTEPKTEAPTAIKRCECPKHFSSINRNGTCVCDCLHGCHDCLRFKRGKEHFSLDERKRIAKGECLEPQCAYGPFNNTSGGCAKKTDVISKSKEEY